MKKKKNGNTSAHKPKRADDLIPFQPHFNTSHCLLENAFLIGKAAILRKNNTVLGLSVALLPQWNRPKLRW